MIKKWLKSSYWSVFLFVFIVACAKETDSDIVDDSNDLNPITSDTIYRTHNLGVGRLDLTDSKLLFMEESKLNSTGFDRDVFPLLWKVKTGNYLDSVKFFNSEDLLINSRIRTIMLINMNSDWFYIRLASTLYNDTIIVGEDTIIDRKVQDSQYLIVNKENGKAYDAKEMGYPKINYQSYFDSDNKEPFAEGDSGKLFYMDYNDDGLYELNLTDPENWFRRKVVDVPCRNFRVNEKGDFVIIQSGSKMWYKNGQSDSLFTIDPDGTYWKAANDAFYTGLKIPIYPDSIAKLDSEGKIEQQFDIGFFEATNFHFYEWNFQFENKTILSHSNDQLYEVYNGDNVCEGRVLELSEEWDLICSTKDFIYFHQNANFYKVTVSDYSMESIKQGDLAHKLFRTADTNSNSVFVNAQSDSIWNLYLMDENGQTISIASDIKMEDHILMN